MVTWICLKNQRNGFLHGYFSTTTLLWEEERECISVWRIEIRIWFRFIETIPSESRKGLTKLLVQQFIKWSATDEQMDMFVHVRESNFKSLKLFESIGFQILGKYAWVNVKNTTSLKHDRILNKLWECVNWFECIPFILELLCLVTLLDLSSRFSWNFTWIYRSRILIQNSREFHCGIEIEDQ